MRRKKRDLTDHELMCIEGARYCKNFDPANYWCIQCLENEEGKFHSCFKAG